MEERDKTDPEISIQINFNYLLILLMSSFHLIHAIVALLCKL